MLVLVFWGFGFSSNSFSGFGLSAWGTEAKQCFSQVQRVVNFFSGYRK